MDFDGHTYSPKHDRERLDRLIDRVLKLMLDGRRRTLPEIQAVTGGSETGVSAKLRDLRKPQFGNHDVQSKRLEGGAWEYWIEPPQVEQGQLFDAAPRRYW